MGPLKAQTGKDENHAGGGTFRSHHSRIERREWWLWAATVVITLLLTLGLASFLLPSLHQTEDYEGTLALSVAVRSLVGLVLLFNVYIIYQQVQIHRIRCQLVEKEELFRLISENAADMIAVVDMEGHRIYNSLAYQKVLGYSPEELRASSSFAQIHPEDQERVRGAAEEARLTGQGKTLEYRIRHKDGTWRMLESTSSVIRNVKGEPVQLVIVNRDISERKRAEEALRLSEASFRAVVEDAPYGIYRASMGGQLLQVNPALQTMLGYASPSELLQANLASDIYRCPEEYQRLNELLAGAEEMKDVEVEWKRKDGAPITVRCSGRRLKDANGVPAHIEAFAEDVTEKRVLERQLRMAQKMEAIGRLSGGIAHDFNNLLGVIIGYSQVLKRELGAGSPLYEHTVEVEKAGQRAATLTRQLLAFSRQQVLTPAVLNLNALFSDMEKMLPRLLGEDIEVTTALDPGLGCVKADQGQIEQVVMNLAVNARDAMQQGGQLKIETANAEFDEAYVRQHPGAKRGHYIMLSVTDTGVGIDAETQVHIFEPFFTTKELGKGTGLGLSTVYGVVKQSGGYITVESAPGKGASFKVYLPRIEEQATVEAPNSPQGRPLRGAETVLLVEDEDPLRKLAQTFLETNGYRVLSAPNGEKALEAAAQNSAPIQLLLTDVVMPGMNGRVLAEQLVARQPGIKVLYMSGYTDSFIAGHGVLKPGTYLLHKPFTEEALVRKVREVLDAEKKGPEAPTGEATLVGSERSRGR
ncbi:MAG: PAS domain S-box protein [Acidobacteriia bacterium]|nr:PAS domain S-box protein [Terriglobia bacterium]